MISPWIASALLAFSAAPALAAPVHDPLTYTVLVGEEADSLDPAWSQDVASMAVILNIYERLFQFEGASMSRIAPVLAGKVPTRENGLISADGRTYTIPIRAGVRFHDGSTLTAEDVRYSFLRFLLSDRSAGPSWLLLEPLTGLGSTRDAKGNILPEAWAAADRAVSVKGDALVIRLPRPFSPLLSILASRAPVVLSKTWMVAHGGWDGQESSWARFNNPAKQDSPCFQAANGTGPFKLLRWDRTTRQIILRRNDGYWRKPAKLETVVIKTVPEFATRKLMLGAGDADAIAAGRSERSQLNGLPDVRITDDLSVLATQAMFFGYRVNPAGNPYIGSGSLDGNGVPPDFFSDKDVREGFAYAFDAASLVKDLFQGKGALATGCIPPGLPGHAASIKPHAFDLERAAARLRKAGKGKIWDAGFKLTYASYAGDELGRIVGQMLKRNIERLNPRFKIDLRVLEWPAFLDARKTHKLPLYTTAWSAKYPDPHDFVFAFLHSRGLYPSTQGFSSPELDRLIESAAAAPAAKRAALYAAIQRREAEEVPHLLLPNARWFRTERSWVKGWVHNPVFPNAPYESDFYPISKE